VQEANLAMKSELFKTSNSQSRLHNAKYAMYFHYKCQSEETSPVYCPVKFTKRDFGVTSRKAGI